MSFGANQAGKPSLSSVMPNRSRFRLLRYFTIAGLASFLIVGVALYLLEERELAFFKQVQQGQSKFFRDAQAELAIETEQTARKNLVTAQEIANVNLTQLFANALWESDFAPLVKRVQSISLDYRNIGEGKAEDVRRLAEGVADKIKDATDIDVVWEVEYLS